MFCVESMTLPDLDIHKLPGIMFTCIGDHVAAPACRLLQHAAGR